MTEINQFTNYAKNFSEIRLGIKEQDVEKTLKNSKTDLGIVNLNSNKSEKFEDVFNEMSKNVPDRTSTISEKELAISYIDRLLACDDISDDLKIYWQNKKSVIQMEMQNIKNDKYIGSSEKVSDVWNEYEKFIQKYQNRVSANMSAEDRYEYLMTYNRTAQSFVTRLMNCVDVTNEQLLDYKEMYQNFENDMQNCKKDLFNAKNRYLEFYYSNFNIKGRN